jgi:dTDP-4-amino-4,6-dideoxygalactose transaminase
MGAQLAICGGKPLIPSGLHRPWPEITEDDRRAVDSVLNRGILCGSLAPNVVALEKEWAWYCGVPHCLATNSGTSALHCSMAAFGVRAGDEVIVPALSFVATAFAVAYQGAIPVFCDISPRTFNIDPDCIGPLITKRTKAIIVVHLHGLPADMKEINDIARQHGLVVIEDAAQAHGATYRGKPTGNLGDAAAFSLNATKNLVGGEGGLFVTHDKAAYRAARRLAMFGEDIEKRLDASAPEYLSHGLGWNYRCSELTAALARSMLRRLDKVNDRARGNAAVLDAGIASMPATIPPPLLDDRVSIYHKYRVRIDRNALDSRWDATQLRNRLVRALQAEGVAASLWHVHPLPANPAFRKGALQSWAPGDDDLPLRPWHPERFPVTSRLLDESLVLGSERFPIYSQTPELMSLYIEAFRKVLDNADELMAIPEDELRPDKRRAAVVH